MNAVDLFAGPGGWDVACRTLGIEVLGVEVDRAACATRRAAGFRTVRADVAACDPDVFGPVDGLIASPPCPTFSAAGQGAGRAEMEAIIAHIDGEAEPTYADDGALDLGMRAGDHAKTWLVTEPLRWARALLPEWIALEQVPPVLPIWKAIVRQLEQIGYSATCGIVNSECFGVPQTRSRAILIAGRTRQARLPQITHSRYHSRWPENLDYGVIPWVSMTDAVGWNAADVVGFPRLAGAGATITRGRTAYRARDLRAAYQPAFVLTEKARSWRRWTDPCRDASVPVTLAEASALQTFPPDYPWQGTRSQQFHQIGNAVPPRMALAILQAATGFDS